MVGYYVKDNKNYALCQDGSSIEIDEQYLNMIVHFPLLSNFKQNQRKQLCEQFQKHRKVLTRELIEKFAEIVPYKTSYDKNMFKITMQDGNIVYTNLKSIKMLSKYQSVLTKLKGQSVCLVLDSTHSTIEKVNCDDLNRNKRLKKNRKRRRKRPKRLKQQMKNLRKILRFKKNNSQQKMNLRIRLNGSMMITQACIIMKPLECIMIQIQVNIMMEMVHIIIGMRNLKAL